MSPAHDTASRSTFAGTPVALGETAELRLQVAESYTAEPVTVPVTVVRGAPGPTLFVTATVHGDELNGVGILRGLLNDTDFSGLRGTLIAVPVVNVPGFLNQDRRLPDRRDLNRSFPGSRKGSLTARLADTLFREVIRQSDFGHRPAHGRRRAHELPPDPGRPLQPRGGRAGGRLRLPADRGRRRPRRARCAASPWPRACPPSSTRRAAPAGWSGRSSRWASPACSTCCAT